MVEDQHAAVTQAYRQLAARYDRKWAFYVEATVRETLRRMPPDPGDRVLDVACGTGAFLQAMAAARPAIAAAGVDLSPEMLVVARQRLQPAVALLAGSAEALPFADGSFDCVVTTNAFHFFRTPETVLDETRRILRPGGTLVVTDWCDDYLSCRICDRLLRLFDAAHHRIFGSAEFRALLEAGRFEVVEIERYKISWLWGMMTAVARRA